MNKKICAVILSAFLIFSTSCSYRRAVPPKATQVPENQNLEQPPNQNPNLTQGSHNNQRSNDNLAKSDMPSVEENINGISLEHDFHITNAAEKNKVTQMSAGITQIEATQMNTAGAKAAGTVLQTYQTKLPAGIKNKVQYTRYDLSYDYFLVINEKEVNIYSSPDPNSSVVCKAYDSQKLALLQKVSGTAMNKSNEWYKVSCRDGGNIKTGYIHSSMGMPRTFQFDKMLDSLKSLQAALSKGELNHISNYKNVNGAPPAKGDSPTDEYGIRIYQSAPGYSSPDINSDFRYVPDGMLVKVLGEDTSFYRVLVNTFNKELYVPKKYIDRNSALKQASHVVVVDRNQQNQASFEIKGSEISMLSYTLATTGLKGDLSFETPLGYYRTIEKKDRFQYLKDGSTEIAGYAPFATRFSGGAYIHGVPVAYVEKNGELVDPGIQEYLQTIGTFPRSHMCVRNFTSHAEFIYNWVDTSNGAVIVIE